MHKIKIIPTAELTKKKQNADATSKWISLCLSWFFSLVFFALIIFIIVAAIPGFKAYGWSIFGSKFDLSKDQASIWFPLCVTLIISSLAILIATPLSTKVAVFIKYRIHTSKQKPFRVAIELLADIPSVIFGLFACESLGTLLKDVLHTGTSYNLITAGIMLTFMVLPTIVSLSLNALDGVDNSLIAASMVLGNTKTRSIYKVCKKQARNGIVVGVIIAFARAIGETMAVSMILQSMSYNTAFAGGFLATMTSGLRSLGALISSCMFADIGGPNLRSLLFAFGLFMFIFVMILNAVAMYATKRKTKAKWQWWSKVEKKIAGFILFIPNQIRIVWESITYKASRKKNANPSSYFATRVQQNKFIHTYTIWKQVWEIISVILVSIFLAWIIMSILINGVSALATGQSTVFSLAKDSTGQAVINTALIILIAIGIGLPFSLFIALYLNEFAREGKIKKILLFFIDSLGATPSILFGMFGLIFFIQTLGLSSGGTAGKSLIAGALTILIVILPVFIRTIQQALESVPKELRTNSFALGAGRWETIRKIVLPAARQGITTAIILSIGRILAETAPLYLTSGLSASSSIALNSPGQTLTTRIYDQIFNNSSVSGIHIMYECAFVTMILVFAIIVLVHIAIPAYYARKQRKLKEKYRKEMYYEHERFIHAHIAKLVKAPKLLTKTELKLISEINDPPPTKKGKHEK